MNVDDVDQRIIRMISELSVIPPDEIKPQDRLREDLGLDSVCSMELLSMLAEELDLDIAVEDAVGITTVAATLQMAHRYLDGRAA